LLACAPTASEGDEVAVGVGDVDDDAELGADEQAATRSPTTIVVMTREIEERIRWSSGRYVA
jgi:hypothetical protein